MNNTETLSSNNWYAIVTFGRPSGRVRKVHRTAAAAIEAAVSLKGTGTCQDVHVLEFPSRRSAADADISDHRGCGVRGNLIASY